MKVFMVGGTGLLGSEGAAELIRRGHEVVSVALPPLPQGAVLPPEMQIQYGNILEMSDEDIKNLMNGCEGFVFAAGVDERVEGPPPIYDMYKKFNIDPVYRLFTLAKICGVKHAVILGSYFSHFDKKYPEMQLSHWHSYIRSRRDQEAAALSFADGNFDVAVLELPYIFGTQPGRKPVWLFMVEMIRDMEGSTLFPKGGTTMVTVKQVGQAIAGALEKNEGGNCYPIGWYNMTWKQMLGIMHKYLGCPNKRIVTIPKWMFDLNSRKMLKQQKARNVGGGLNLLKLGELQCSELFINKSEGSEPLGVQPDNIEAAIGDSIRLCVEILDKNLQTVEMKGE